jgi:hypothetical protein
MTLLVGFFKRAADAKNLYGQCNYGVCLEFGLGVEMDVSEAAKYSELREISRTRRVNAIMGFVLGMAKEFCRMHQMRPHI